VTEERIKTKGGVNYFSKAVGRLTHPDGKRGVGGPAGRWKKKKGGVVFTRPKKNRRGRRRIVRTGKVRRRGVKIRGGQSDVKRKARGGMAKGPGVHVEALGGMN